VTDGSSRVTPFLIGVVSDTHGVLSDEAYDALKGVDTIVHAGDIGDGLVLDLLEAVAPVVLVRGNSRCKTEVGRAQIADVVVGGARIIVAHRAEDLPPLAAGAGAPVRLVVTGHTHVAVIEERGGVLHVNPGSPSQPRKGSAASVALVEVGADGLVTARIVTLV